MLDLIAIQYIVAILSAIAGFFAALKPVRAFALKCWQKTFGRRASARRAAELAIIAKAEARQTNLEKKQDEILAELRPNGSSSMRDAVDRIEDWMLDFDAFRGAHLNTEREAMFRTDANGSLFWINRAHQRLLGYSLPEMEGNGWINCVHPDNRSEIVKQWEHTVGDKMELNEDIKFLHANGYPLWAHANVYRALDIRGRLRGYLGVISQTKKLKERVNEEN